MSKSKSIKSSKSSVSFNKAQSAPATEQALATASAELVQGLEQATAPTAEQALADSVALAAVAPVTPLPSGGKAPAVELRGTATIKALVLTSPKRGKCALRAAAYWPVYVKGGTVDQAIAAGATRADLRWDLAHGFITIG